MPSITATVSSIRVLLTQTRQLAGDFMRYAGWRGAHAALLIGAGSLLEGVGLVLVIPLLGVIIHTNAAGGAVQRASQRVFEFFGVSGTLERLGLLLTIFALLIALRAVVLLRRDVTLAAIRIGFVESLRGESITLLTNAAWSEASKLRHARVTHVISGDIQRVGNAAYFLVQAVTAVAMLLAQIALAFLISPAVTSFTVVALLIGAVVMLPMLSKSRDLGAYVTNANLSLLDTTAQFLGGLKLAISQNLQKSFLDEFLRTLRAMSDKQVEFTRRSSKSRLALATFSALVGALVVFVGFGLMGTSPAVLITLLLILSRMNGPATQIQQGLQQLSNSLPAYSELKDLNAELAGASRAASGTERHETLAQGDIAFRVVTYRYVQDDGQGAGVEDLNLDIPQGCFFGISGSSGAGKTTFADLLVGLVRPQHGEIRIGGRVLDDTVVDAWRSGLSYVSQDSFLFHDSLRRNLAWARPDAGEAEMWAALALAGADTLVRRMEKGLDTVVGERGSFVSGGERQRIAVARAMMRKPSLLVLDEATSAIDVAGEREIIDRLLAVTPRPTIVMIAHRAESLQRCDAVAVFERGRAVIRS